METVTISKSDYDELVKSQDILDALNNTGVDNWSGYDVAMESMENLGD